MGNQFSKKDETQEEREYLINLILEITDKKNSEFIDLLERMSIEDLYILVDVFTSMIENEGLIIPDNVIDNPIFIEAQAKAYSVGVFFNTLIKSGLVYDDALAILNQFLDGDKLV